MNRMSVFQVHPVRASVNDTQLAQLVEFLVRQRHTVLSPEKQRLLLASRAPAQTPIAQLYSRYLEAGKGQHLALVDLQRVPDVPEVITFHHLPLDLKQLEPVAAKHHRAVSAVSELKDKIVLNITALLRRDGELGDVQALQTQAVRDLLSRSYYVSPRSWLAPPLLALCSKVYSMLISAELGRIYELDDATQRALTALFAWAFLAWCSDAETARVMLRAQRAKLYLPDGLWLDDQLAFITETLGAETHQPTLDDLCRVAQSMGVPRLQPNRKVLQSRFASLDPFVPASLLALEYPPAFVHQVLQARSGAKTGMAYRLDRVNLTAEANAIARDLLASPQLLLGL